jgi:hypothetical protein
MEPFTLPQAQRERLFQVVSKICQRPVITQSAKQVEFFLRKQASKDEIG